MNFDGMMISSILPPMPVKADLRSAQIQAANDPKKKFVIARALVQAKIARSLQVLDWLAQGHDITRELRRARLEASRLSRASTVSELRTIEGRVAQRYWEAYAMVLPQHLEFQGRMTSTHNSNASDPVNSALNYGYGLLEGECRRAINAVGLEPSVGFLHDFSDYQTKHSLVYDLEEPYRWLIEISVLQAFKSRVLDWSGFFFTGDDYRYRFTAQAKTQFIELLKQQFNRGLSYKGQRMKWDTIIQKKVVELSRFFVGKSGAVDFEEPSPKFNAFDDRELRSKILALTQSDATGLGIGKSTFHYLRRNARRESPFRVYGKVREKLTCN
jgi:CRISPR-associated protein Cas1